LDDIVSEKEKIKRETGVDDENASDELILKIEVPANRYDLLCEEGITRALNIFLGNEKIPSFNLSSPVHKMIVENSVMEIRPYIVCAVLRNFSFGNKDVYDNFISLQTKLHQTVCRRRTLASVGTHDLDKIEAPFYYRAQDPNDISFIPLNKSEKVNGHELMTLYENDPHLGKYLDIIRYKPRYPVVYDSKKRVLSLPPIINSDHSKISLETKNILIEVTAFDLTKANIVLNTIVTMFSEYCDEKFSIEPVIVMNENQKEIGVYPIFENREVISEVDYINRGIGINLEPEMITSILYKMGIPSHLTNDKKSIVATITPTRTDIFHKCDLVEDVAIAFGYNNIIPETTSSYTSGSQFPLNSLSDKIRGEVARCGYTEILTFSLISEEDNFTKLRLNNDGSSVKISNPATIEFQVVRTRLLPCLLKNIAIKQRSSTPFISF